MPEPVAEETPLVTGRGRVKNVPLGGTKRAPWRCRHGFHKWMFVSMSDRRMGPVMPYAPAWVCDLVEECDRCHTRRTKVGTEVPANPKIATVRS